MNQAPSGAESSVKELTQRRQDAMGAKQKFLATSRLCVFALKISPPNMPPRRGLVPRPADGRGCRRQVRDLVFLVWVLQICLSLIHISEPTRQAEISYAVFC